MKQYAARGNVDLAGSTSEKRCDLERTLAGITHKRLSEAEASEETLVETGGGRFPFESCGEVIAELGYKDRLDGRESEGVKSEHEE